MEIRPQDIPDETMIEERQNQSLLAIKTEKIKAFCKLLISDISIEEDAILEECIVNTYEKKGISHDNKSLIYKIKHITHPNGSKSEKPIFKTMPILEDLYNELEIDKRSERLSTIIGRFVKGSARSFNGQTNVDLNNKYIVIDISELSKDLLNIGMYIALDFIWDKAKDDRTQKKAVFIDEAWRLLGENKFAAEFVLEVFKIIRGYGGAAIAATQNICDFFRLEDGKYGKAILNNSKTKIVLQLEPQEVEEVAESFKLSEKESKAIRDFGRGEALVISNSNTFAMKVTASEKEKHLITTDRELLNTLRNKRREERRVI